MSATPQTVPVSVVIPCFRNSETISRCLDSVFNQQAPPSEVVVVFDHGDAETRDELLRVERSISPLTQISLQILENPTNLGPAASRNAGWDAASQPYVAFLDADDSWLPEKLATQLNWMLKRPHVELSYHGVALGRTIDDPEREVHDDLATISLRQLLTGNDLATSTVMVRNSDTFRFDPSRRYSEDYDLWLRMAAEGVQMLRSSAPLTRYHSERTWGAGLSSNIWKMEQGELANFVRLWKTGRLAGPHLSLAILWSLAKFVRRAAMVGANRLSYMGRDAS